jgi:uncharacterized protein (DUF2249 family)
MSTHAQAPGPAAAEESITADWKISRVIAQHPPLLETLAGIFPGFARLRNPVLRALRAPRISVAQAARVAGLSPDDLARRLNAAAGLPCSPTGWSPPMGDGQAEGQGEVNPATVELDVRELPPPEPMLRILEALPSLAGGQVLLVRHARRPVYLYPRLEELGYVCETRELSPGQVELRIRRRGDAHAARDSQERD